MSLLQRVFVSVTASVILAVFFADAAPGIGPDCLGCLCEAATQCNATTQCHVPYAGAYFCGPFHISYAYWADAGKLVLHNDNPDRKGAFENCATNLDCAANVVREYMNRFGKDCDGNGVVSCNDYARLHKLGKNGCTAPLPSDGFTAQYHACASRLNLY